MTVTRQTCTLQTGEPAASLAVSNDADCTKTNICGPRMLLRFALAIFIIFALTGTTGRDGLNGTRVGFGVLASTLASASIWAKVALVPARSESIWPASADCAGYVWSLGCDELWTATNSGV